MIVEWDTMMMQCAILLVLCGQLAGGDGEARQQQIDDIVRRHRDGAVALLTNSDPCVSSAALDALATLDCDAHIELLRAKLNLSVTDPALEVALHHLIGRAAASDLKRVREIVGEAAEKGREQRSTDPYLLGCENVEFLALEVLLASNDLDATRFATGYLEATVARNPGPGIAQMDLALDLVGRYAVKAAIPKVRANTRKELEHFALRALALNDDSSAIDVLKSRLQAPEEFRHIVADNPLVDKLGITVDQLEAGYAKADRLTQIWTAGQLARQGRTQKLHTIAHEILAQPQSELKSHLGLSIAQFGDESFIPTLEVHYREAETDAAKLVRSTEIFQVVARTKKKLEQRTPP